jgi:hypothetical protein
MWQNYEGLLDRSIMSEADRLGYERYCSLKARSKKLKLDKPAFTAREFLGWWLFHTKDWPHLNDKPTAGRIDHKKGYSFDNMRVEPMTENSRESMMRNKTNVRQSIRYGQKIMVFDRGHQHIATFSSIRDAAKTMGISQRLMQFRIRGKYKQTNHKFIFEVQP